MAGSLVVKADTNSIEAPRNWRIPHKFINYDFVSFLSCFLPLDESAKKRKQRPITGRDSVQALASDYQLLILHSIDLGDILKLLKEKGSAEIYKKENYIQYLTQNFALPLNEIKARIE